MEALKFSSLTSAVEISFWEKLYDLKLNSFRLSSNDEKLWSFVRGNEILLDDSSFTNEDPRSVVFNFHNVNSNYIFF
jgi:hypothetical protein